MSIFTPELVVQINSEINLEDRMKLLVPTDLVEVLTEEEKVVIRGKVLVGSNDWHILRKSIQERLNIGPYLDKIVLRLKRDLIRVAQFEAYEIEHNVDLYRLLR